jgi:hypothetical protein
VQLKSKEVEVLIAALERAIDGLIRDDAIPTHHYERNFKIVADMRALHEVLMEATAVVVFTDP